MLVVMLIRQDDLIVFDIIVDGLQVLRSKVLAAVNPSKIPAEIRVSHSIL